MIYLYDSTETDFRYNGKPLPTAYDVTVSNTLNSEYYVMGKYPLDKDKVYKEIVEDRIIKVHTMDGMEPFRIVSVNKYELYVEFEAWPLFYADMRNKLVKPLNLNRVSGQTALNSFKNNLLIDTPFDFYSDITDNHDYHTQDENERENNPKQLYNALDVFKTIVNRWGGELWIRGYDIRVNKRIGTDTESMLYEKKNITEFVDTTNIEGIVTRLHGKSEWQDERQEGEEEGQKHSIEVTVDSPLINDYSGVVFEKQFTNNDIRTEQELKNWLNLKFTTENIDKPQRTIEVGTNVIDETKIGFADTLILKYIKHDTDVRIKVVGYEYDGFANELKHVVLGQPKHTSSSTIGNTITDLVNNVVEPVDRKTTIAMNSADGKSTVFHGTADPNTLNLNAKENDTYFRTNGNEKEIWRFTGTLWELTIDTSDTTKNADAIEKTLEEVEEAKQQAKWDAEQALLEAKGHADAEVSRIDTELRTEVGGAIEIAEQAKQDAIDKANQALVDAKTHADAEVQASKEHFDNLIEVVESDVADAQATADSAVEQIDTAVANAGHTSLDETISSVSAIASGVKSELDVAIANAGFTSVDEMISDTRFLGSSANANAQTAISEAQTAQENSLTALGQSDDALAGVSDLDIRVDEVESELTMKADNTFMTDDGELITLSNAITFNANRFSSDMQRIESRVESLSGEINLVILSDAFEGTRLVSNETYPNPSTGSQYGSSDTMREMIAVEEGEQLALSKNTVDIGYNYWTYNFYDDDYNYVSRSGTSVNEYILTVPSGVSKLWVSYPKGSRPQIVRGTEFIPYRPNLADQMTSDEVMIFRNEYDEFAEGTQRRITAIDGTGGRLETAEMLINQTADGLQTTVGKVDSQETRISTVEQTADGLQETVADKASISQVTQIAEGLDVLVKSKPKNVINNGDFSDGYVWWNFGTNITAKRIIENRLELDLTTDSSATSGNLNRIWNTPQLQSGKKYRVTFDAYTYTAGRVISIGQALSQNMEEVALSDEVQSYEVIYEADRNSSLSIYLHEAGTYEIGNVVVVETSAISQAQISVLSDSITQSVSDLDGRVTEQLQTLESISSTVYDEHEGKIATQQLTIEGLQTTVADKANQSQVTQLATGLNALVKSKPKSVALNGDFSNGRSYWTFGTGIDFGAIEENRVRAWLHSSSQTTSGNVNRIFNNERFLSGRKYRVTFDAMTTHGATTTKEISVGQSDSTRNQKVTITETLNSYEVIYHADRNGPISFYLHNWGQYEIGNIEVVETNQISQAQISVLENNINLRVSKGDVINQINVSTEGILIDGKKTHITGTTTIDDGVIKDAHIFDLHADKITAGTIDAARIDAKLIVTEGLEVDVIEAEHILADTATIDKLFATTANVDILTAKTAFINSIKAVEIDASKITSGTISAARLNAIDIVAQGLIADVIESTHILADTALFDKLFTSDLATDRLSAKTAWITNGMFANASIDGAKIQDATIGSAKIAELDVGKISGDTSNFIQSNWNAINSSIQINAERIRFDSLDGKSVTRAYNSGFDFTYQGISVGRLGLNYTVDSSQAFLSLSAEAGQGINFAKKATPGATSYETIFEVPSGGMELRMQKTLNINGQNILNTNSIYSPQFVLSSGLSTIPVARLIADGSIANLNAITQLNLQVDGNSKASITSESFNLHSNLNANGRSLLNMDTVYFGTNMEVRRVSANVMDVRSNTQLRHVVNGFTMMDIIRTDSTNTGINVHANLNMMGNTVTGQSDSRLKTNIADHRESSLQKISEFNFQDFTWIENGKDDFGLIAQEVQQVAPGLVIEGTDGYLSLNNSLLNMMTTHGLQELSEKHGNVERVVDSHTETIHQLQLELSKANRRIEELESVM